MAKINFTEKNLTFRQAKPEDATIAGTLIYDTFPKVATFLIGLGDEERAKAILTRLFAIPGHRLGYEVTRVAQYEGRIIGLIVAYPGKKYRTLDSAFNRLVMKQYRFRGKLALSIRAWPLLLVNEVSRDEFLLGNLAVRKRYQDKGAGKIMLKQLEAMAEEAGYVKLALRVAIENEAARKLYERVGYKTVSIHLEPNTRVRHMGAGYRRMIKTLSK